MVYLTELARMLDDRPIVGFCAPGLMEGEEPLSTVDGMARRYHAEMVGEGLRPPFTVVGMCIGGVIALELAQRLGADLVDAVALVDAWLPETAGPIEWDDMQEMFHLGRLMTLNVLRERGDPLRVNWRMLCTQATRILPVYKAMADAWLSHEPRPYGGRVILFHFDRHHAVKGPELEEMQESNRAAWENAIGRSVEVVKLPACGGIDHGFEAPSAEVMGRTLRSVRLEVAGR
jgi:thioesterase domain-containing protein